MATLHLILVLAAAELLTDVRAAEPLPIDKAGRNWAPGGRAFDEQHFSPLAQFTSENVESSAFLGSRLDGRTVSRGDIS